MIHQIPDSTEQGILLLQLLGIAVAEFEKSDKIFDRDRGLESRARWPRSDIYEDRPPGCEQKHHTEATPYTAIILSRTSGNFLCMGSILAPHYVLTVRECLLRDETQNILVMAGYLSAWWGRGAQVKRVEEIVKNDDDLAILKLQRRFTFNTQVKPVRLSGKTIKSSIGVYGWQYGVVGFSRAPWDVPGEPMPKSAYYELKFGTPMIKEDIETCQNLYADTMFNASTMFCSYSNMSFCWGNLGSPTVVLMEEQLVQMGIVVRAYCDEGAVANLNLRIDAYSGWIRSNAETRSKKEEVEEETP